MGQGTRSLSIAIEYYNNTAVKSAAKNTQFYVQASSPNGEENHDPDSKDFPDKLH